MRSHFPVGRSTIVTLERSMNDAVVAAIVAVVGVSTIVVVDAFAVSAVDGS